MVNPEYFRQNPGMAMNLKNHIGMKVCQARKRLGLTQPQLAERVDLATETISNIERGASYSGLKTLLNLSHALGVPLRDFFIDVDEHRQVSRMRLELESTLQEFSRQMSERDLRVTVDLVKAMVKHQ